MGLANDIKQEIIKAYTEGYKDGKTAGEAVSKWVFFFFGVGVGVGLSTLIATALKIFL